MDGENEALPEEKEKLQEFSGPDVLEIDTERRLEKKTAEVGDYQLPENMKFNYLPLWDVPRNALTTYFCLPVTEGAENNLFEKHKNFYHKLSPGQKISLDLQVLRHTIS